MNIKERISKLDIVSIYVYAVSFLMLSEVIVFRINERTDWAIIKWILEIFPESFNDSYFLLVFLLTMFSIYNIIIVVVISIIAGILRKNIRIVIVGLVTALCYYKMISEIGTGLI